MAMQRISKPIGTNVADGISYSMPVAEFTTKEVADGVVDGDVLYVYSETAVDGYYIALGGKWREL